MRRLLAVLVLAALLLGLPASAPAKGIVSAQACGADGCHAIAKADRRLLEGGPQAEPPAAREPFVRLRIRIGAPDHPEPMVLLFLPRSELLLGGDGVTWMHPASLSPLRVIARRITPYPARALPASAPLALSAASPGSTSLTPGRGDDGPGGWWLALGLAAIADVTGAVHARRRRRGAPAVRPRAAHR